MARACERVVERVELGTNRTQEDSGKPPKQTTEYQYKQNARDPGRSSCNCTRGNYCYELADLPLRIPTTGGLHNREALARLGTRLRHGAHHRPRRHGQ